MKCLHVDRNSLKGIFGLLLEGNYRETWLTLMKRVGKVVPEKVMTIKDTHTVISSSSD